MTADWAYLNNRIIANTDNNTLYNTFKHFVAKFVTTTVTILMYSKL